MAKANAFAIGFLKLQIAKVIRLVKEKTQNLRQHHLVNIRDIQYHIGADRGCQQWTEGGE